MLPLALATGLSLPWMALPMAAQGADILSTKYALDAGYVEANPVFRSMPVAKVNVIKVGAAIGFTILAYEMDKSGHHKEARIFIVATALPSVISTVINIRNGRNKSKH